MDNVIYDYIVIRYGELSTKGRNRKDFLNCLHANIRRVLKPFPALTYEKFYDGMYIHLNGEEYQAVAEKLKKVFGYAYFAGAIRVPSDLDAIKEAAYKIALSRPYKTFKVNAHRNDKSFPMTSDTINRSVAGHLLANTELKVNVHEPDLMLYIFVKKDATYVMDEKVQGPKGYPVGINHKALLMISGGIDSPVAGYVTMKRGMRLECVHFASQPYTSEQALDKVKELLRILSEYQGEIILHVIPFTELQMQIYRHADESYAITLLRRMMYRIADRIAKKRNILTIVNGESVGQVASQTLESMSVIGSVCDTMILRPLCMADKLEIIDQAVKIGTYETSILPYEDCCTIFAPKNPVTKPKAEKCERYEARFDYEKLIEECLANDEIVHISFDDKKDTEELF